MNVGASNTTQADIARKPVTIIRPPKGWMPINLRELWAYRELLYFFTWRDIKVRYKQTLLGFAGPIMQPPFIWTGGGLLRPMLKCEVGYLSENVGS